MSTTQRVTTAEELWRMPDDGLRHEIVRGGLRTMSPSGSEHAIVAANLIALLGSHVRMRDLGLVFGCEGGFIISRNPDTVRAPDAAFIRKERIPEGGIPKSFWTGPPDLAVEVISPSDRLVDVEEKVEDWLHAGAQAVWVINPTRRTATVHAATGQLTVLREDDALEGGDLIEGFVCRLGEIFV